MSTDTIWSGAAIGTTETVALLPFCRASTSAAVKPMREKQPTDAQKVNG